jgi:tetratricopeptide (TPR) repeat protein
MLCPVFKTPCRRISKGIAFALAPLSMLFIIGVQNAHAQGGAATNNPAYVEAQKALRGNDPVNAARLFYTAVTSSEGSTKDKSEFGLAESLRKLGLNYSAAYFHARIVHQGPKNDFFRNSFEALAGINSKTPLGKASVSGLLNQKIDPLTVPAAARGFFFFYKGLDAFDKKNVPAAKAEFERVPSQSPYYGRAQYYLGVILTLTKDLDGALSAFSRVARTTDSESIQQLATLNLGRIHYEKKDFRRSLSYFAQMPRDSDLWLESLFEGAWAFFMLQKHNNALGNVHTLHSPFFANRFFPESYILNAITYLRLCRVDAVRKSLKNFQERYKPTFSDLKNLLIKYQNQSAAFFTVIARYNSQGSLKEYPSATEVIDNVSRSDAFKEAQLVVRYVDKERASIKKYGGKWEMTGLSEVLRTSLEGRKTATIHTAGEDLYDSARLLFKYLLDLSNQTQLINLDRLTSITDKFREQFGEAPAASDNTSWGEGMRPLSLKDELEYWPFEGEWWEDELGGYVYNIDSQCGAKKSEKGSK